MNNLTKSILFIAVFLAASLVLPGKTLGLTCANAFLEPAERLEASKYVFVGNVTKGNVGSSVDTAEVVISKTYKGKLPERVMVELNSMWDSFSVKSGSEYLFLLDSYTPETNTTSREPCNYDAVVDTSSSAFKTYERVLGENRVPYSVLIFIGVTVVIVVTAGYMLIQKAKKNKPSRNSSNKKRR